MNYTLIMLDIPVLVSDEFDERGRKIIAGFFGKPKLDLSLIADEIGWVDVEKLAKEYSGMRSAQSSSVDTSLHNARVAAFKEGFKAAQSLNEKKWTDDDMIDFYNFISSYPNRELKRGLTLPYYLEKFKQSRKPKEYQVECIQEGNTIKVTKIIK